MPAILSYNYGKGEVIATTLYSDVALLASALNRTEKNLIRDLVSWARNKGREKCCKIEES